MSGKCAVCQKEADLKCSNCSKQFYCCKDHQIQHWKNGHNTECIPYKVKENEELGRFVVAKRLIKQGEVIMQKSPLVLAPKLATHPLCLGCHKKLSSAEYRCKQCSWPLCGKSCEKHSNHSEECKLLEKINPTINFNGAPTSAYSFIAPLRVCLMQKLVKDKYNAVMEMQNHLKEQENTPVFTALKQTVLPIIGKLLPSVSFEDVLRICSIFDTNSFDVRSYEYGVNARGLYPSVNLLAHNCTKNTCHYFLPENNFTMVLIATVDIQKGELITNTYTQTLWGTLERRLHLQRTKCFDCACKRCKDTTEFGFYVGNYYCEKCVNNKSIMISQDPMNNRSDWICKQCGNTETALNISKKNQSLKNEIMQLDKTNKDFERFLEKHKNILPPNNSYILQVKYALVELYGKTNTIDLQSDVLLRKITLIDDLLNAGKTLEPGISEFNNILHLVKLEAQFVQESKNMDFKQKQDLAMHYLENCKNLYNAGPKTEKLINTFKYVVKSMTYM